jgi:hypothetical protein
VVKSSPPAFDQRVTSAQARQRALPHRPAMALTLTLLSSTSKSQSLSHSHTRNPHAVCDRLSHMYRCGEGRERTGRGAP